MATLNHPIPEVDLDPVFQWINNIFGMKKKEYFASYIPDEEQEFYEIFAKELSNAKTVIYNSGDGFSMNKIDRGEGRFAGSDEESCRRATSFWLQTHSRNAGASRGYA